MNRLKLNPLKLPPNGRRTAASDEKKDLPVGAGGIRSQANSGSNSSDSRSPAVVRSSKSLSSRTESSVRFRLEEDEILGGSGEELSSVSSGSATPGDPTDSLSANDNHHDDSLEIMEEIVVPADDDDDEGGGSSSVRSAIHGEPEIGDSSVSDGVEVAPLNRLHAQAVGGLANERKRQLFDIGGDEDLLPRRGSSSTTPGDGLFDIDRLQLSGGEIAAHFQPASGGSDHRSDGGDRDEDVGDDDEYSIDQVLNDIESVGSEGSVKVSQSGGIAQSSVAPPAELGKGSSHPAKELSPLKEDDVLINDLKLNLNTLRQRSVSRANRKAEGPMMADSGAHDSQEDTSLNTTNDISDLARDTESERVGSVEFEADSGSGGGAVKVKLTAEGRSRSVEEIGTRPVMGTSCTGRGFASLGPIKLGSKPGSPPGEPSSSSSGASVVSDDLREKILSTSKSFDEVKALAGETFVEDKVEGSEKRSTGEGHTKQMERVTVESKEALEDISEESEHTVERELGSTDDERRGVMAVPLTAVLERGKEMRTILEEKLLGSTIDIDEDNKENIPESGGGGGFEFESVVSVKMFQTMENEIRKLQELVTTKDVLLEAYTRRESCKDGSRTDSLLREQQCRSNNSESVSLTTTNSTEYRPVPGELEAASVLEQDLHGKILERNQWIQLLADKLRESLTERNQLQADGERLTTEVVQLKKQLSDAVESVKLKTQWAGVRPDHESTSGQRISEISIDLVSETEDGGMSDFPEAYNDDRPPSERAFEMNLHPCDIPDLNPMHIPLKISKQLDQFRRYLSPEEVRLFNMVQTKLDEFLRQELEKAREADESEHRVLREQVQLERAEREQETNRLRQMLGSVKAGSIAIDELRKELEARHTQEMADLRTYFEKKVVELEKHYSEEVFSQQSRRLSNEDTASEISGAEEFPEENGGYQSKHTSPRRKHKDDIFLSPTHRKITPTTIDAADAGGEEVLVVEIVEEPEHRHLSTDELREFYQHKIKEIKRQHERLFANLHERLRAYETAEQEKQLVSNQTEPTFTAITPHTRPEHCSPLLTKPPAEPSPPVAATIGGAELTANSSATNTTIVEQRSTLTPVADALGGSEADLQEIILGYERRLQEQVALARQDVLKELEVQIQALLSDTSFEDSHWPAELVLLREKFTAKSQLEVAQLQLKHEEEMARMKNDFEKQLQRKLKRHTTFDSTRGLDKIINERDNLRELSSTLRNVLGSLAKCFSICEEDLNATVLEELQRYRQNVSLAANATANESQLLLDDSTTATELNLTDVSVLSSCKVLKFAPDVSGIISIIDDPSLVEYVTTKQRDGDEPENVSLNLEECLERLKAEALSLLSLSERLKKSAPEDVEPPDVICEKGDSCEEEDGLKRGNAQQPVKLESTRSLDANIGRQAVAQEAVEPAPVNGSISLPIDLAGLQVSGELNLQLHELKNRLLKSEDERKVLEHELAEARSKQCSLVSELSETKQHLLELNSQRVEFSEGYGTNALLPTAKRVNNTFVELQERAKAMLSSTADQTAEQTIEGHSVLLQMVEDFCREGERYMEDGKRDRMDLQLQIEAADKQLKATRQFLEDQAAEREQERDEFVKEIDRLRSVMREKEKDKVNFERATKEDGCMSSCRFAKENEAIAAKLESVELQVKELTALIAERDERVRKMEGDLKDSIDKGFTLREIIAELETQIESKAINEHVLEMKVKELEKYIDVQNQQNESLHQEMESIKADVAVRGYDEKIAKLEDELRRRQPSAEHSIVLEALTVQLRDIEETLERKTKNLETLNSTSGASLGCSSPSEDISVNQDSPLHRKRRATAAGTAAAAESDGGGTDDGTAGDKPAVTPLPVDEVQRIFDKLHRHSRIEDVAIKRINDLEMQITNIRVGYAELQHERDVLQEKMSEQSLKISSLQTKLDEQRLRAEELHRQGTSQLTVKVHDLQNELHNLKETLQSRDKQIGNLKQFLDNSQQAIARQEKELAMSQDHGDRGEQEKRLEAELRAREEEVRVLKDRIKNEMISKAALPDLMETMLADKNEEIDQLKERLGQLQCVPRGLAAHHEPTIGTKDDDGGRTLSDVVSITDYDESDMVMRRIPEQSTMGGILAAHSIPMDSGASMHPNHSKQSSIPLLAEGGVFLSGGPDSTMMNSIPLRSNFFHDVCSAVPRLPDQTRSSAPTPECIPRQINFSLVEAESPQLAAQRQSAPAAPSLMFFGAVGGAGVAPRPLLRVQRAVVEEIFDDDDADVNQRGSKETAVGSLTEEEKVRLEGEVESLKLSLDRIVHEKNEVTERLKAELQEKIEQIADLQVELAARNKLYDDLMQEKRELRDEVEKVKLELQQLDQQTRDMQQKDADLRVALDQLHRKESELSEARAAHEKVRMEMESVTKESSVLRAEQQRQKLEIDTLRQQIESLNKTIGHKDELMAKLEKDLLNYSKNEEKYLEQLRSFDAKETELKIVQGNYKDRLHEIEILNEDNRFLTEDINRLKNEIARSSSSLTSNTSYVQALKQSCVRLEEELQDTKVLLTEKMLALERIKIDLSGCQREVEDLRTMLKEKDMVIRQIGDDGNSLHETLSTIQEKMQEKNVALSGALRDEKGRSVQLQAEVDRLRAQLQRSDNSSSPKPFSVEEIAEQLEKELNYSAQLDSSILKAIESDDVNSDDGREERAGGRKTASRKQSELDELRQKLKQELDRGKKMQELLETEKANSTTIQQQDADIIEAMRIRLEAALANEGTLQRLLEEERTKNERLSRMVGGLQRTKSFDNYLLMKGKSPQESPQRRLNRSNEFEAEMVARYEAELKFLTAQNTRERERTADLQRVLERERERFEKEITDRTEHGEQVKRELNRVAKEKESLELELDHEQEKLELAHKEIDSLEKRIGALQEAEALRSARRDRSSGQNSLEYQELKLRLEGVEFERNQLRDTVVSLRTEVDRRRTREAQLTEALSRENSLNAQNPSNSVVPEEFINKLKDLNRMLEANARENHQQAESLRFMMEERRALQMRIQELERYNGHTHGHHYQREDLEERANHLFGKYLRSESHRKALVHQKRYLQIVLTTYEENEARALALLNAQLPPGQLEVLALASGPRSFDSSAPPRRKSFRSIVTVVVAIERMKYLVRKWHGGRRVCAKAIFSQPFSPRRSQSARTNVWARSANSHFAEYSAEGADRGAGRTERTEPLAQLFGAAGGPGGVPGGGGAFVRTLSVPVGSSPTSLRMNVEVMETLREHQPGAQYGNR